MLFRRLFLGNVGSDLSDRISTQTDTYLMSNDGRRRKNLAGDNLIYGGGQVPTSATTFSRPTAHKS